MLNNLKQEFEEKKEYILSNECLNQVIGNLNLFLKSIEDGNLRGEYLQLKQFKMITETTLKMMQEEIQKEVKIEKGVKEIKNEIGA
jgi:hypothetical protein